MKTFVICMLVAIVAGALAYPKVQLSSAAHSRPGMIEPQGLVEDELNKTIEGIRDTIPEPIELESLDVTLPEGGIIEGPLSLKAATVSGIKGFQLTELKVNIFTLEADFTINVPELHVQTDYVADLKVPNVDTVELKGEGSADVLLKDLKVVGKGKANLVSTFISVSDCEIVLSLGSAAVTINGLVGGDDADKVLNDWINNDLVGFLEENQKEISAVLGPLVEQVINTILNPPETLH